jgi:Ca2+-binding EF-hand superfamily protein
LELNEIYIIFFKAWETYDEDKNNVLDMKEFKKLVRSTKIKINEDEMEYMMKISDKNQDGVIDMEEFISCFYDILKIARCHSAIENLSRI